MFTIIVMKCKILVVIKGNITKEGFSSFVTFHEDFFNISTKGRKLGILLYVGGDTTLCR